MYNIDNNNVMLLIAPLIGQWRWWGCKITTAQQRGVRVRKPRSRGREAYCSRIWEWWWGHAKEQVLIVFVDDWMSVCLPALSSHSVPSTGCVMMTTMKI